MALNAAEGKRPMTQMVSMNTLFSEILFVHSLKKMFYLKKKQTFYENQTCSLCLTQFSIDCILTWVTLSLQVFSC